MGADIQGVMGFALPKDVIQDHERKGRLRANTQSKDYSEVSEVVDFKRCHLHDLATDDYQINFADTGFDSVDLSSNQELQTVLSKVKAQGAFDKGDIGRLRRAIRGSTFKLSNGKRIRMVYVAGEGNLVRTSGPNALEIKHDKATPAHSKQAAAMMIHGDQDVYGFPLKRIMKGAAPFIFNHRSPDGNNKISPVNLVNFWIPLHQSTMPLCLMDRSSLDRQKHQLRFEINVADTLERNPELGRNDIWTFLHDDKQEWYIDSEMDQNKAYVFDTLGVPHGAAILPGEKEAEKYFLRIQDCKEALKAGDKDAFVAVANQDKLTMPPKVTAPLANALANMESVLDEAANDAESILAQGTDNNTWLQKAESALGAVTRKSIELRAVGIVY